MEATLVVGGTGKTGRRVVARLEARGVPVRVASRSSSPPFDWDDQASWAPALGKAASMYLTYYPDLAAPGAAEKVGSFAKLAVEQNVRRLVLLSGRGEEGALLGEQAVQASGADWTIVRSSWFSQNFSESFLLEPVLAGQVALPAGKVGEPFIDADDIAEVVVAALTQDGHTGQLYEVTGPRLLTFAEAVAEIAKAADRQISYLPVTPQQFEAALTEQQVPADYVWLMNYLFTEVLDGRNAQVTDGVQRALGRQPRDFTDYARDAAATGIWAR